jgi:hypothetical protein
LNEYQKLKFKLEENEFVKSEQLFYAQLKLEQNSKKQVENELSFIKKEIERNDELAIHYLKKYVEKLQKELNGKTS